MKPRLREVPVLGHEGFQRLAYAEWGSPSAAQTIVCVHGVSRNGRDFDVLAARLAEDGARVIAPDLPGRGRSDWLASPAHYTDRAYTRAMATLIARLDVEQVDWVGTSLGGHIGMLMAAAPQSPVRRLVLNDFGARISAASLRRIGTYLRKPWRFACAADAEAHLREVHAPFGELTDAQWQHLAEHSIADAGDAALRFHYDPAIAVRFALPIMLDVLLWQLWEKVECPVLILRGESSDLLSAATVDEMQRRGPTAHAGRVSAVELPGCGHAPALRSAAQVALVRDFLMPHGPSTASARSPTSRATARGPGRLPYGGSTP
jgi:pimeloyl-ACP methyl ester carboxylesterase